MLNRITIMGRLTRDPEIRYTQSQKPVASFTVAVDRDRSDSNGQRTADFINCTAWGNSADFLQKHFKKGSMAIVTGRLQIRNYEDRNGNKRTAAEVVADRIYFGEPKRGAAASGFTEYDGPGEGNPYTGDDYYPEYEQSELPF